ncbi:beta-L-arabinofuranosidase domain-containing protein [Herbiconiux liukaitaii]|uniref:beta-L-arabinofuranosidase domain-containing protein n=1 Tax=Herbiconiux liukaitaii TaxID=3342799 RepID=UPI0035B90080
MMPRFLRLVAMAAAPLVLAGGLMAAAPAPSASAAADPAFDAAKVLDLRFDGDLADAGPNATAITMQKGDAAFAEGARGQAFEFSGSSAISLGTAASLQPSSLTASFWFKPSGAMTGEQVFSWSKTVYNSDGWYLTSASDSTPLALSIGPGGSQPYQVAVDAPRAEFFPADEWTHVVATYDETTKAVAFYRNGERQTATVKYPATGTSTGVLGSESTSTKTLGYNGPTYNGSHVRGLLDDYRLYDAVASTSDVVALTQETDPAFDPAEVAQRALDSLTVPASAAADFPLSAVAANGAEITWTSSDPSVVSTDSDDGQAHVTRPEAGDADVTLTATATYGGSEARTKDFVVTVPGQGSEASIYVDDTDLSEVLLEDPYLVNGNQKMVDYLLTLDPERFLSGFYTQAGLPTTAEPYGGWERTSGTRFQGHFFGHLISALSQAYSSSTDPTEKAALLEKLTIAIDGLERAQTAYAAKDPANAGYVSPFPVSYLPHGSDGLLVPFYNLHKVLAGLVDAHEYATPELSQKALTVASGFGTWLQGWASRQADPSSMLNTEYGGMNEALYNLYAITENPVHKRAAEYFDEVSLFRELAAGNDVLNGRHANTTIPKLIGALKRYTVFTDNPRLYATLTQAEKDDLGMYRTAAENFWQMVVDDHSYANGGNSQSEHFHAPGTLHEHATNGTTSGYGENSTSEVCNEYNMLKLTRALFQVDPQVKYPDFYEHTYINTILAQQNPETGMMTYFQPMAAGYAKVFGAPEDEFWCDHGTATESFTKLGDSIYFRKDSTVYVNMFRSSVFTSEPHNLELTQTADVPASPDVQFTVDSIDGGALAEGTTLRLRIPHWVASTPTLTVNGQAQDVAALTDEGYLVVPVSQGDSIQYTLPAEVTVDDGTENPDWVAFRYGPVLLATELNRNNVDADYLAGVLVRMSVADKTVNDSIVVPDAEAWKAGIAENLVRLDDGADANGTVTMRFGLQNADAASEALVFTPWYSLYDARYAIYMNLIEPDSAETQALIRSEKEKLRIAEMTTDSLVSFDNNNSEADKNYKYSKSATGVWRGQGYRDGQRAVDAYFQYDMVVDTSAPKNYLGVRYFGGDDGRTFDVYVNDVKLKSERITNAAGADDWYVQYDELPADVLAAIDSRDSYKRDQNGAYVLDAEGQKIPVVTVRFQGNGTSFVGGVYGVYTTTTTTFDTAADLSALQVEGGTLSPDLADGVYDYTITVPVEATSVVLDVDPAVPSGLIFVDGILIDDTVGRTVAVAPGAEPTTVVLRSSAQDHTTEKEYRIRIVREAVEPEPTGPVVDRIAGADRYEVAVNTSKAGFPTGSSTVYVASGAVFADALSAASAATVAGAPILLTTPTDLPTSVSAEIERLGATDIVVVGGEATVSRKVAASLSTLGTVTRIGGADRYEASRNIAAAAFPDGAPTAVLATGSTFADALSAGAAIDGAGPVILVNGTQPSLDAATKALLADLDVKSLAIAGGEASVSAGIQADAAKIATTVRLGGADRFAASRSINDHFFTEADHVLLATGLTFPDALAGSAYAPRIDAPLFTVLSDCIPAETLAQIEELGATKVTLLGGTATLTEAVENLVACP